MQRDFFNRNDKHYDNMTNSGKNCLITGRIAHGGCKVGYMYREQPVNSGDSGWRFFAGDESEKYLDDFEDVLACDLNFLCGFDADIAEFLKAPAGSTFYRDENGQFVADFSEKAANTPPSRPLRQKLLEHMERYICRADYILYDRQPGSKDIDIAVIEPSEQLGFFTLMTLGMSDIPVKATQGEEARSELFLCLPNSWNPDSGKEEFEWPVRLLRDIAKIPAEKGHYLTYGHVFSGKQFPTPFASDTKLCAAVLDMPELFDESFYCCIDPPYEVTIYYVLPIYADELRYKEKYGAAALLERLHKRSRTPVLDIGRKSVCGLKLF